MIKRIVSYISLVALCLLAVCFTACNGKKLKSVPFSLNIDVPYFEPSGITLIKNTEEFDEYLSDRKIFAEEFGEEFIKENKKYDEDFFAENDLIAVRRWAPSIDVEGYRLNNIYNDNGVWAVNLSEIEKGDTVRDAMGRIFCYYIPVEKDPEITGVEFKW